MSGELTPLVLIPRYSTYVGAHTFTSIALDVTNYVKAYVSVWRGAMTGTSPTFSVSFEESTDQVNWTVCTGGTAADPGADTEAQYTPDLKKRYFRIKVVLGGTSPAGSCWAMGSLERRVA
jgi:hypothetical protein